MDSLSTEPGRARAGPRGETIGRAGRTSPASLFLRAPRRPSAADSRGVIRCQFIILARKDELTPDYARCLRQRPCCRQFTRAGPLLLVRSSRTTRSGRGDTGEV